MSGRARRGGARRRSVILAMLVVLVAACTGGDEPEEQGLPDPPPVEEIAGAPSGRDVAVVLPAATEVEPAVLDDLELRLRALADELPEQVGDLHVLRPDAAPFVPDLLELAAARDARLACVLGSDTEELADTIARRHGRTTVCSLPALVPLEPIDDGSAPPAARIDVPVYELGVLVGTATRIAARAGASPVPEDEDDEPIRVGLVLRGDELDPDRFRAGLIEGLGDVEAVEAAATDGGPEESLAAVVAAGVEVVVLDGGLGAAAALAAVPPEVAVVGPVALAPAPGGDPADERRWVLSYRVRWEEVLSDTIAAEVQGPLASFRAGDVTGVLDMRPDPGVPELARALELALAALDG